MGGAATLFMYFPTLSNYLIILRGSCAHVKWQENMLWQKLQNAPEESGDNSYSFVVKRVQGLGTKQPVQLFVLADMLG